jgi:hypothetical protein
VTPRDAWSQVWVEAAASVSSLEVAAVALWLWNAGHPEALCVRAKLLRGVWPKGGASC